MPAQCVGSERLIPHGLSGASIEHVAEGLSRLLRHPGDGRRCIVPAWINEYLEPDDLSFVLREVANERPELDELSPRS